MMSRITTLIASPISGILKEREARKLVCILLLAMCLRLAHISHCNRIPLDGDERVYSSIARNIVTGRGYQRDADAYDSRITIRTVDNHIPAATIQTAQRGPSYIFFVAGVYGLAGRSLLAVRFTQAFLGAVSCLLAYSIGYLLFRRTSVGMVAALLHALYPQFITYTASIMTETFVTFMVLLSVRELIAYYVCGQKRGLYTGTAAMAIGALSKPMLIAAPVLFSVAAYLVGRRKHLRSELAVQLLITVLVFAPWVARNAAAFHAFVPTVTQGGHTFWIGTDPPYLKSAWLEDGPVLRYTKNMSELQEERWFYQEGIRIIRSNPRAYVELLPKKFVRLWFNLLYNGTPSTRSILLAISHLAALVLGLIGAKRLKPPRVAVVYGVLLFAYFSVVHMAYGAEVRLAIPAYAYIFIFTAAGCIGLWRRVPASSEPSSCPSRQTY